MQTAFLCSSPESLADHFVTLALCTKGGSTEHSATYIDTHQHLQQEKLRLDTQQHLQQELDTQQHLQKEKLTLSILLYIARGVTGPERWLGVYGLGVAEYY